jgi:hypothetical protein
MEHQQVFPHGLLYSITPGNISSFHLNDASELDEFNWNHETRSVGVSFTNATLVFLKSKAIKWGLLKA